MSRALIGCTGFVGTNLLLQARFEEQYNSRNIQEICGRSFDIAVCAAAPATMWLANKDPESDLKNIRKLLDCLSTIKADHMIIISTIAVLDRPAAGLDEDTESFEAEKAYGRNRRYLEGEVARLFAHPLIIRLPALFGVGLKKNSIFDMMNPIPSFLKPEKFEDLMESLPAENAAWMARSYEFSEDTRMYAYRRDALTSSERSAFADALFDVGFTALNFTHADSVYQYYDLSRLWSDICLALEHELPLVHLAPEPMGAAEVYSAVAGKQLTARTAPLYREDMRTRYSSIWGGPPGYIQSKADVLASIKTFCAEAGRT